MKIILFCLLFLFPAFVFAQNSTWFISLAIQLNALLQNSVALLVAVAMIVFIWGMVVFIMNFENEQARAEGKKKMVWGLVGLFIIISVWGIVSLIQTLTGIGSASFPGNPQVGNI